MSDPRQPFKVFVHIYTVSNMAAGLMFKAD
jgi:hypothetical protein